MTADPLLRHAVGGGIRCCETDWQQPGRTIARGGLTTRRLRADDGLAPATGRSPDDGTGRSAVLIEAPLSVPIVNLWWPVSVTVLSARKVGPDEVRK